MNYLIPQQPTVLSKEVYKVMQFRAFLWLNSVKHSSGLEKYFKGYKVIVQREGWK